MKKCSIFIVFILFFINFSNGQDTLKAYVFNKQTKAPISYAYISTYKETGFWIFKHKSQIYMNENPFDIVTTNDDGFFILPLNNTSLKYIKIIAIGYEDKYVNINELSDTLYLEKNESDKEVIIYAKKPVIYFYPTKKTKINIKLNFRGNLSYSYPEYQDGWNITAEPSGLITNNNNKKYKYLFWEGEYKNKSLLNKFTDGFIIQGKKTSEFLDSTLTVIGLNYQERNDFIVYWLPRMKDNKYNFIHFMTNSECNKIAEFDINPKPDTEIRVYMIFSKISEYKKINKQKLERSIRTGFIMTEWGGISLNSQFKIIE